jgi:hypothetical protein
MTDFIDAAFADLDDFYPGSKRKRKDTINKQPKIKEALTWDAHPFKKPLPNGKEIELFTIGALAMAVDRPVITIRSWMKEGYIPQAPYRLPGKKDKNGKQTSGRRLWSRAMIEDLVKTLEKNGLLYVRRIEWPLHRQLSNELAETWNKIREEETK